MANDEIEEVGVDDRGRLFIKPTSKTFPLIYREAVEIHWDEPGRYLFAPEPPRSELKTPLWWFCQIIFAARAQGCQLTLTERTRLTNVSDKLREGIDSIEPLLRP